MTTYNLATLLETSAKNYPEREAIVFPATGRRMTYAEVDMFANMVADFLVSKGIQPGDKVALSCPNLPYFSLVYWGILKAGATVVPLNVLLKGREVAYHLGDSDAKAYFCFEGTAELPIGAGGVRRLPGRRRVRARSSSSPPSSTAESPFEGDPDAWPGRWAARTATFDTVQTDEDDTAVILYTSGTTGQPKGAELRHRNMRDNALLGEALFGADADDPDTFLCVLPLFHSFGQTVIQNGAAAFGGTVVMLPRFEAGAALELMQSEKITFFAGVPTMYWGLLGALEGPDTVDVAKIKDEPAGRRRRRRGAAGRGAQGVREEVRRHDPRGLRTVRDLAGRQLLAARRGRPGRLDRQAGARRRDEADRPGAVGRGRVTSDRTRSARSRSRATTS